MKYAPALFVLTALAATPGLVLAQNTLPPTAAPAGTTAGTPYTGAPQGGQFQGQGKEERHPEIHRAMKRLEGAKADLQQAAHDYDGHRAQAVQLIDQAEDQLRQSLQDAPHK